jgi:hypothetical protein
MYIFLITYYLAILTFYLGVLIYSLPIPLSNLKRWAPRLIADAFYIMALLFSISSIARFSEAIQSLLGGSWEFFLSYMKASIFFRTQLLVFLGTINGIITQFKFLLGLTRLISMIIRVISASLYAFTIMYAIATFVRYSFWSLIALGLALMAIPFRIARNAGAFLIAFALVFNTALPLYIQFTKTLILSEDKEFDTPIIFGNIINMANKPLYTGYIGLEYPGGYIGPIPVYSSTYIVPAVKYLQENLTVYYDVCGHIFYTNITSVSVMSLCKGVALCKVNMMVYGLVEYREGIALHAKPFPKLVNVTIFTSNYIEIYTESDIEYELYVSIVDSYKIKSFRVNSEDIGDVNNFYKYRWYWYNLNGKTYATPVPPGKHRIEIELTKDSNSLVEPDESYIYEAQIKLVSQANAPGLFDEVTRIMYIDIIGATFYVSLLLSISFALARLLGGATRLRVTL